MDKILEIINEKGGEFTVTLVNGEWVTLFRQGISCHVGVGDTFNDALNRLYVNAEL